MLNRFPSIVFHHEEVFPVSSLRKFPNRYSHLRHLSIFHCLQSSVERWRKQDHITFPCLVKLLASINFSMKVQSRKQSRTTRTSCSARWSWTCSTWRRFEWCNVECGSSYFYEKLKFTCLTVVENQLKWSLVLFFILLINPTYVIYVISPN